MSKITREIFENFMKKSSFQSDTRCYSSHDTKFSLHRCIELKPVNKTIVCTYDLGCYGIEGGEVGIGVNDCKKHERSWWREIYRGSDKKSFLKLNLEELIENEVENDKEDGNSA